MENTDIIGGVSPLKQVVKAKRSGKYGKRATVTEKQRGGFSVVTDSTNRGGYNVNTSFKPAAAWVKPADGGISPNIAQKIIGGTNGEGSERWEYENTPATEAKTGNEFADNCYNTDGSRKEGHTFYSEVKGYDIACKWGGKSDGSFDYDKEGTKASSRKRKVTIDPQGNETYHDWEVNNLE